MAERLTSLPSYPFKRFGASCKDYRNSTKNCDMQYCGETINTEIERCNHFYVWLVAHFGYLYLLLKSNRELFFAWAITLRLL
jgi:hypothetical protein